MDLASEAFDFTKANWRVMGRLAFLPFAASLVVFIIHHTLPNAEWLSLLSSIVAYCAMGMFAVAVHRFYLLEETPQICLRIREFKFVLILTLTGLMWSVPLEFSVFVFDQHVDALHNNEHPNPISFLGAFICVGILYFAVLRLTLVFPIIATAKSGNLLSHIKYSWQNMRGNVVVFLLSSSLLYYAIGLFVNLSIFVLEQFSGEDGNNFAMQIIIGSLGLCVDFLYSLFLVIFASYIFKKTRAVGLV